MSRVARTLRTLRYLRPRQALAQGVYSLRGQGPPIHLDESPPELALHESAAPFLPAPAHIAIDPAHSRLRMLEEEIVLGGEIDFEAEGRSPLFVYHLHQFDWLRHATLSPEERAGVILDWTRRHRSGEGWDPHPISLRVLNWGKLLLTPGALALDSQSESRLRLSFASQLETLARNVEVRLQANHLLSNLIGVVFGGLLFQGARAERWLLREAELRCALVDQVGPDGMHVERSPMYHALLLENLLDLLNLARVSERTPAPLMVDLVETTSRMLGALRVVSHPDGQIALFSDSAFGIAHELATLARYAGSLGVGIRKPKPASCLHAAGYTKLAAGPFVAIVSHAGPRPAYQPGHAHCDALAFELSVAGRRVVTDTGVCEYKPGPLRDLARTTASHSTLQLDGREQAELWAAHRIGGRPRVEVLEESESSGQGGVKRLLASCRGWAHPHTIHERRFALDEQQLVIRDRVLGPTHSVRLPIPLAPGLSPQLEVLAGEPTRVRILLEGLQNLQTLLLELPSDVSWRVESAPYFPAFGTRIDRACLVGEGAGLRDSEIRFRLEPPR